MNKLRNTMSNLFHPTAYLKKNNEDKIFNSIYGRDDIKQIILIALRAEQPVHVLLTGEPGCGKTTTRIERILQLAPTPQRHACWIIYLKNVQGFC